MKRLDRSTILNRHRAVVPRLDAQRHEVISKYCRSQIFTDGGQLETSFKATITEWARMMWQIFFTESKRFWIGVSTVWLAILLLDGIPLTSSNSESATSAQVPGIEPFLEQRQRLLESLQLTPTDIALESSGLESSKPTRPETDSEGIPSAQNGMNIQRHG